MRENEYNEILKLCKKAEKNDCVPVGAIVVKNNKIIGKGYNKKEKTNNPLDHAEIIAIKKATKKLKNWRLNDCKIIVSMIPCEMCKKVIYEARIGQIIYILDNEKEKIKSIKKENNTNIIQINEQMYVDNMKIILNDFFSKKRKKSIR